MKSYKLLKRVVNDIVTEKDGQSFDIIKVVGVIGLLIYFGLSIYTVILNPSTFNYMNWGTGFGLILGAIGGAVKVKETTEQSVPTPGGGSDTSITQERTQ